MGIRCILLWLLALELANHIPDRPIALGKIFVCLGVRFFLSYPTENICVVLTNGSFIWGGVLMRHAACKNFGGLMAARFFLGVGEAAIAPGFALLIGMFYKREEQPMR